MFGKDQLAGLMKQAKQMQEKMAQAQEKLAELEVVGEAGAGLVKVTMTAKFKVKKVEIDPTLFKADEMEDVKDQKEMIEDLVAAAFNAASVKAEEASEQTMGKFTAGIPGFPGGKLF